MEERHKGRVLYNGIKLWEKQYVILTRSFPIKNCAVTKIISSGPPWSFRPPSPLIARCSGYTQP